MTKPVTLLAILLLVLPFDRLHAAEGSPIAGVSEAANDPDLPAPGTHSTYWRRNSEGGSGTAIRQRPRVAQAGTTAEPSRASWSNWRRCKSASKS
jgi:hypothetical protein